MATRLAPFLGPAAKVLARRAAAGAESRDQRYLLLAEQLGSEAERRRFLDAAGVR